MKFMIQFRLKPGSKNKAMEVFERRGPSRNPGVTLRDAWIGAKSDVVFVLVESDELASVEKAGQSWAEFGSFEIFPVLDIQQM
jgi:hypothetical protein